MSKQRPHQALMYLYVMQIYSYLNCQIFCFTPDLNVAASLSSTAFFIVHLPVFF